MNDLQVRWCDIHTVIPYKGNCRKIPERAVDKVAASIKEYGWHQPIVVDKDFVGCVRAHQITRGEEAGPQTGTGPCRRYPRLQPSPPQSLSCTTEQRAETG